MTKWVVLLCSIAMAACNSPSPSPKPSPSPSPSPSPNPSPSPDLGPAPTGPFTVADLRSPDQRVRDAAAVEVRAAYKAPPRSTWEPMLKAIKEGDSKESVIKRMPPDARPGPGAAGGGGYTQMYQLDGSWMLECGFIQKSDTVIRCGLIESMEDVWVDPPKSFTGVWTTYQVNGQRSHEINYRNGTYHGTFTSFRPDGTVAFVQNYGPDGLIPSTVDAGAP